MQRGEPQGASGCVRANRLREERAQGEVGGERGKLVEGGGFGIEVEGGLGSKLVVVEWVK